MQRAVFLLILFFAVFYLLPLNIMPLWMPDEARYAEISREMINSGDWIVPRLLGLRYFEKPIAGYWFNSLSQLLFGDNHFSVRFTSALSTLLSALLIVWFTLRIWANRTIAFYTGLIYLSFMLVYGIGNYSVLDAMFTLWVNAAMVCFYLTTRAQTGRTKSAAYFALGLICGIAFLIKGFIALALPVIVAIPFMLYQRRFMEMLIFGPLALLGTVLITLPWASLIHLREADYWNYFFWVEHVQRFAADNAQHKSPFWFYIPILILGLIPWLGLLPNLWQQQWRSRFLQKEYLFLALWILMPLLFFSIAKGKLLTYILPCFAPLALLLAAVLHDNLQQQRYGMIRLNAWLNGLLGLLVMVVLIFASHQIYTEQESYKIAIGLGTLLVCALLGLVQLKNLPRLWALNAFISAVLAVGIMFALPNSVIYSKMMEPFLDPERTELQKTTWLVSNEIGMATALAWEMKRSNIILLNTQGELRYGLNYPDVKDRYLTYDNFAAWLEQARRQGDVAVLFKSRRNVEPDLLPRADRQISQNRFTLLIYQQRK